MSDPQITEEMIEAGARAMVLLGWDALMQANKDFYRYQAECVLRAALAGRTVLDLPEPHAASSNEQCGSWIVDGDVETDFAAFLHWDDASPVVEVSRSHGGGTEEWGTDALRTFCLNGLAACEFADRLAAVSSKGGEPRAK